MFKISKVPPLLEPAPHSWMPYTERGNAHEITRSLALHQPREGKCLEEAQQLAGRRICAVGSPLVPQQRLATVGRAHLEPAAKVVRHRGRRRGHAHPAAATLIRAPPSVRESLARLLARDRQLARGRPSGGVGGDGERGRGRGHGRGGQPTSEGAEGAESERVARLLREW